ncbi:MAG: bifunctional hydroxymethylpyrimidine kinase/phosphomethylpyrimidine kinase [Verrucomicrobiae bacterium]|nr:bifunctional hydroxymethylpyrimidine kinase/phosphomethylpyrimidine kinase [Verrucomicrobiae bacterium]
MQALPIAMTIAGSDNSGGAGIEADLKTFTTLGVYGTCAVTCVVAENPARVKSIQAVRSSILRDQIDLIFEVFPVQAIKTGMLYSEALIKTVVDCCKRQKKIQLVIDPVMVATSGACLLKQTAIRTLEEKLIPLATLVTPNLDEASLFLNEPIKDWEAMQEAAFLLQRRWKRAVLLKGGHLKLKEAVDILATVKGIKIFRVPYEKKVHTHGTGCTFSAAITASLAKGFPLEAAVRAGKQFVTRAIMRRKKLGRFEVLNHLP